MAVFGRSTRQGMIWDELQDIRDVVDYGLLGPDDGGYDEDDGELQIEWEALVTEYNEIHTANETKG